MAQFWPAAAMQLSGTVTVPVLGVNAVATATVSFDGFTSAPRLEVTAGNVRLTVAAEDVTTTSARIVAANWSPAATAAPAVVRWAASAG